MEVLLVESLIWRNTI